MIVHHIPQPHLHGCPKHPLGGALVTALSTTGLNPDAACFQGEAEHDLAWHTAVDPLIQQSVTLQQAVAVPPATLATIAVGTTV